MGLLVPGILKRNLNPSNVLILENSVLSIVVANLEKALSHFNIKVNKEIVMFDVQDLELHRSLTSSSTLGMNWKVDLILRSYWTYCLWDC